jgi:hypothetical protein
MPNLILKITLGRITFYQFWQDVKIINLVFNFFKQSSFIEIVYFRGTVFFILNGKKMLYLYNVCKDYRPTTAQI